MSTRLKLMLLKAGLGKKRDKLANVYQPSTDVDTRHSGYPRGD